MALPDHFRHERTIQPDGGKEIEVEFREPGLIRQSREASSRFPSVNFSVSVM